MKPLVREFGCLIEGWKKARVTSLAAFKLARCPATSLDVRFGSQADIGIAKSIVRFVPLTGQANQSKHLEI